uniref:SnoaL-like domain-containing protein n=1 Tax=Zooxanthella nutricula TaxID=1333877 RepID=A0A7S2PWC9_9DINO
MRKAKPFALSEEELVQQAKLYLAMNSAEVTEPSLLAKDFEFCGPVVGPLGKDKFIEQLGGFNLVEAFPDIKNQWYDFRVDPFETDRVWFTCRSVGTNLGPAPPLITEPTGKRFENAPQMQSLRFNEAGEVVEYTAGYVLDRRQGNAGGLGGLLGILYAIGKPFPYPECKPYERSWQRQLFEGLVEFLVGLQPKPSPAK